MGLGWAEEAREGRGERVGGIGAEECVGLAAVAGRVAATRGRPVVDCGHGVGAVGQRRTDAGRFLHREFGRLGVCLWAALYPQLAELGAALAAPSPSPSVQSRNANPYLQSSLS